MYGTSFLPDLWPAFSTQRDLSILGGARINDEKDPVKLYEKQTYLLATLQFANQDEIDSFRKELLSSKLDL